MNENNNIDNDKELALTTVSKVIDDVRKYGYILTRCPKCHSDITMTIKANRMNITCDCKFIIYGEIYD